LPVGEQLAAADKKAGGKVMVGYHKRSDPATIWTRAEIDRLKQTGRSASCSTSGFPSFGRLRRQRHLRQFPGRAHRAGPQDVDPTEPGMSKENADAYIGFVNFFIHQINLIRHLLGEDYKISYVDPKGS